MPSSSSPPPSPSSHPKNASRLPSAAEGSEETTLASAEVLEAAMPARVEPATVEDLPELTNLVMSLFEMGEDFEPNREKQMHGLRLILEQPNRGRIFVVRTAYRIVGMVSILFTISTAEGGFVILMEDVIIQPEHRGNGYGAMLLQHVIEFAKKRDFRRITLLTDKINERSQHFFHRHGFKSSTMVPMRWIKPTSPTT